MVQPLQTPHAPCLLALDSATEPLALALVTGGPFCWRETAGGPQASSQLIPAVQSLMAEAGCHWSDLHGVVVGRGPGAFTGLRSALAVAQGLALGLSLPVLTVDSLLLLAEAARAALVPEVDESALGDEVGQDRLFWALADARMGEVYAAAYRWQGAAGGWQETVAPFLGSPQAVVQAVRQAGAEPVLAGSALPLLADLTTDLPATLPGAWVPPALGGRAPALARLARQRWSPEAAGPPEQALPLYLRDKVALTMAERAGAAR